MTFPFKKLLVHLALYKKIFRFLKKLFNLGLIVNRLAESILIFKYAYL